jgi:hypothetical protein
MRSALLLLLVLLTVLPAPSSAHLLNMSKARIQLLPEGEVEMRLALDLLLTAGSREAYFELSRVPDPMDAELVQAKLERLPGAIHLMLGDARVPLTLTKVVFPQEPQEVFLDPLAWPRTELTLRGSLAALTRPPSDSGLRVRYDGSFRFEEPIANTVEDTVTGGSQTRWLVTGQVSPLFDAANWIDADVPAPARNTLDWSGLIDFAKAGLLHILPGGIDHLLFVAGLCLGAASMRALIGVISLFTVAHSLTLCAMVLGWVSVPSAFVEAMILLSILWVAVANLLAKGQERFRYGVVVLFGLLHGLGFAGALLDLELPSDMLVPSLLAFNVGVEIGQLLFVLLFLTALQLVRRGIGKAARAGVLPAEPVLVRAGSLLIALAAVFLIAKSFLRAG